MFVMEFLMSVARHLFAAAAVATIALNGALAAETLAEPTGSVVLTVTGSVEATNGDGIARLDREMLRALPRKEFKTQTIWTEGEHRFSGVPLKTLLDHLGAQGQMIIATAINDYSVEIPVASLSDTPIVADQMDGSDMSVRGKGPLWIVYPYDSDEEFRTEVIYSRSIWQLDRLEVK